MLSLKESLKILKETKALLDGHFILSSGLHSPQYVQCAQLMSVPDKAQSICNSLAEKIKNDYRKKLINRTVKVLFENKMSNTNRYFGRDEYFNSVIVESNKELSGEIKNVKILKGNQNTLFGEVISNLNQTNYAA